MNVTFDNLRGQCYDGAKNDQLPPDERLACASFPELLKFCKMQEMDCMYPNMFDLLVLLATIPVSAATAERCFSAKKRVLNRLRSTVTQGRLQQLLLLTVEADQTNALNLEASVDYFIQRPRRIDF
ncbi:hypothetical protein SKAU_G00422660 [Synaphobranchus kaupii]|nr:hypothetical protein SKAU_G00422660 [Synaphobranchus kaupii]